jgi:uncharacterized membrane protein YphA (DoxX/SURF4 family)
MSQLVIDRPGRSIPSRHHASGRDVVDVAVKRLHAFLNRYSIHALRISLGLVFLGFGVLKFFPGYSPAEQIASATLDRLTLGLISGHNAVLLTAVTETVIGLILLTGVFLRFGIVLLGAALIGIMSPLALFTAELFPHGPTLMGQYVLKDIIIAASALVVGAYALGSDLRARDDR